MPCATYNEKEHPDFVLDNTPVGITLAELKDFLTKNNLTGKDSFSPKSNGVIGIVLPFFLTNVANDDTKNIIPINAIHLIEMLNMKTGWVLKWGGYKLGVYLSNLFFEHCSDWNPDVRKKNLTYDIPNDWKDMFFKELGDAITQSTRRMLLKNKKDIQADAIQQIENDMDYAILDTADKLKEQGVQLERLLNENHTTSISYRLCKFDKGSNSMYYITFRKDKTGKFTMRLFDYKSKRRMTKWFQIKKDTDPGEVAQLMEDYFSTEKYDIFSQKNLWDGLTSCGK